MGDLELLWHAQGGECFYCGQEAWLASRGESMSAFRRRHGLALLRQVRCRQATREHLKRRCEGGRNEPANFVMSCQHCNSTRDSTPVLIHLANKRAEAHP
jgi:hypothetical protein